MLVSRQTDRSRRIPFRSSPHAPPWWVLRAPSDGARPLFDADYARNRYWWTNQKYNPHSTFLTAIGGTFTRASEGRYWDSAGVLQTAASGALRFDHDPSDNSSLGILLEGARTNLCLQSEDLGTTWVNVGTTESVNAIVAPDGDTTADKIVEDGSTGGHLINQTTGTLVDATTYTVSAFMKAGDNGFMFLVLAGNAFASTGISVNLTTGVVSTAIGTPLNVGTKTLPNGWFRVWFSLASTAADTATVNGYLSEDGVWANRSYTGDSASGDYIWGSQIEAGSFPSSYIKTTTVAVTRAADSLNFAPTGISATAGTVYCEYRVPSPIEGQAVWSLSDNSISDQVFVGLESVTPVTKMQVYNGAFTAQEGTRVVVAGALTKTAAVWAANDVAISVNGAAVETDNTVTLPAGLTYFDVGQRWNSASQLFGHISRLTYFPSRISNADLVSLTS